MKTTDNQEELFYWVDEHDRVLGKITRREAHSGSLKIHRGVWVLVFNHKDELFLQKRSLTKDNNPGVWSLSIGGHVTYGQTYEDAVKRESREELGVTIYPFSPLNKYRFVGGKETEIGQVYKSRHDGPFQLHPQEIDRGEFFSLAELEQKVRTGELVMADWALAIIQAECGVLPEHRERKQCIIKVF